MREVELEEKVFETIVDFFIESNDFNGITLTKISRKVDIQYLTIVDLVADLVRKELVVIQYDVNPHIIGVYYPPIERQLAVLTDAKRNVIKVLLELPNGIKVESDSHTVCAYPTRGHLEKVRDVSSFIKQPFTRELSLGEPQLKPVFFEIDVLERYFKDPRYSFEFDDYSGSISYLDREDQPTQLAERDQFFLKTFGLGLDKNGGRVATVFLRYLSDLTEDHQLFWKSKEIPDGCTMLREYYENTIQGNWHFSHSIFSAFIEEQSVLNDMCKHVFGTGLFKKIFTNEQRPKEFTFFLIPTLENYNNFVLLLDKMISDNIDKSFFKGKIDPYDFKEIESGIVERKEKGTLRLLEEWLNSVYTTSDGSAINDVFKHFKDVRQQRQHPAHRINENYYDVAFIGKQKEIMKDVFRAMRSMRYIFQAHPKSKSIQIPEWLENDNIKIF
jgi:hypothetical protein